MNTDISPDLSQDQIATKIITNGSKGDMYLSRLARDIQVFFMSDDEGNIIQVSENYIYINGLEYEKHGSYGLFTDELNGLRIAESEARAKKDMRIIRSVLGGI
tara:strand:+ start:213 stop:521 length:309 start_codon:yes stop_codon:yes gene_type:complete